MELDRLTKFLRGGDRFLLRGRGRGGRCNCICLGGVRVRSGKRDMWRYGREKHTGCCCSLRGSLLHTSISPPVAHRARFVIYAIATRHV